MNQNQTGDYNPLNQNQTQMQHPQSQPLAAQRTQQNTAHSPNTSEMKTRKKLPIILGILTIAAFSGIAWVAYESGLKSSYNSIPLIEAESDMIKVKPENPGGQTLPHQNKKVYTQIEKTPHHQKPAPYDFSNNVQLSETPLKEATTDTKQVATAPTKTTIETIKKQTLPMEIKKTTPTKIMPQVKKPTVTPSPVNRQTLAEHQTKGTTAKAFSFSSYTKEKTAPAKTVPQTMTLPTPQKQTATLQTATLPNAVFLIQVGAVKSESLVHSEWKKLSNKFPSELEGLQLYSETVTVNGSTLHRIRGGMMTKTQATSICGTLKHNNIACFVVKKN